MKNLFITTSLLFFSFYLTIQAQVDVQTFSSNGTWSYVVPAGQIANVTVEAWGGGGAGGAGTPTPSQGGGGGGAYAARTFDLAAGSYSVPVTVGTGGTVGGANGGQSDITISGNTVTVNGGINASNSTAGAGGTVVSGIGNPGGTGGAGATNAGGGGGGSGLNAQAGVGGSGNTGGNGGTTGGGRGGDRNTDNSTVGTIGGGGGGRGRNVGTSKNGGNGQVVVTVNSLALPIELLDFSGRVEHSSIMINWQTSSEHNNEKFVVEHSYDKREFQEIGYVPGAGTTLQLQQYQFVHENPHQGSNYYRLKQIDFNGNFTYSQTIEVDFGRIKKVKLFPTLVDDFMTVQLEEEANVKVEVFDLNGSLLLVNDFDFMNKVRLNLSQFASGTYILKLNVDGIISTEKITKI